MIWSDLMETWPDEAYIHPLYERPCDYRPVWHAMQSRGY